MFFSIAIDFWIASQPLQDLVISQDVEQELPLKQNFSDSKIEVIPFTLEGKVEDFDPAIRSRDLARTMPSIWCGSYHSVSSDSQPVPVKLEFAKIQSIGQMVDLRGDILIDKITIPVSANLNAKSDQIDLFLLSNQSILGLEDGGKFLGFDGLNFLVWNSPRPSSFKGYLKLDEECKSFD